MQRPGKLPPLPALRCFEAAARLGSISAAADELHVTHSAVSQQIKSLEEFFGLKLFGRSGRAVVLTTAGQELALGANEALNSLARTTTMVRRRTNPKRMTVTCLPSFAACWLTPRIASFMELVPDVEINLISSSHVLDMTRDGIDVAIRWGFGGYEGVEASLLLHDELLPVAQPEYLQEHNVRTPEDLVRCALLRSDGESWQPWFERAGLDWPEPEKGLFFNDATLPLRWAEEGRGVALTRRSLADESLRKKRLIAPFDVTLPTLRSYWFVTPSGNTQSALLQSFRDWMFAEASHCAASLGPALDPWDDRKTWRPLDDTIRP